MLSRCTTKIDLRSTFAILNRENSNTGGQSNECITARVCSVLRRLTARRTVGNIVVNNKSSSWDDGKMFTMASETSVCNPDVRTTILL